MKFGVFDHMDASGTALGEVYEQRLRLAESYERIGMHAYHLAEHHATPLGMAPSPSVFLSALAQRTRRLLFGPLVYTLQLYHPLRLAEEICMLDHMSRGRLQLGVGRGISPFEVGYFGTDPDKGQAMYIEAFSVIMQALNTKLLRHEGEFYTFRDVPIQFAPLQRPHPPLWYGLGHLAALDWCVANRVNVVTNAPPKTTRAITDRYREDWGRAGNDASHIPLIGMTRHMVIADTDRAALEIARRGYRRWYASFMYLWNMHGAKPRVATYTEDFDEMLANGHAIAGSPATVREAMAAQIGESGINYLLCRFAFGDVSLAESLRSVELFAREVMPAFAD